MRSRLLTIVLPVALGVLAGTAELDGQGKGSDKGKGSDNRGSAERGRDNRGKGGPPQAAARQDDRGRGNVGDRRDDRGPGNAARPDNRGRGKAGENRGSAGASDFGRARAAEVRESGGDVAGPARPGRGNGRFNRVFRLDDVHPTLRGFAVSDRLSERLAGRAVALAFDRGVADDVLIVRPVDDRIRVLNREGIVLLDLDDATARRLGSWRVVTLDDDDEDREGAPSFCRSGAGHPVWGRQWCMEKGFGLGESDNIRWGRAIELEDVVLRPAVRTGDLTRDVLLSVLGDVVFKRLAAHAITLGLADPLVGRWAVEPSGRRVLLVNSGAVPVAEIVDQDADDRADVLLVALRPW